MIVKETDLFVHAPESLKTFTRETVIRLRGYIESYIDKHPSFMTTLVPWPTDEMAAKIIRDMIDAGQRANVGPMAAVAGAMAEHVGYEILKSGDEVIVENGGDIFLKTHERLVLGVYAGKSPLSFKVGLKIDSGDRPMAVCTSSGVIGHSKSFGIADAVCVVSTHCALADAAATAVGNGVKSKKDIVKAIDFGKQIEGVEGIVVIVKDKMGAWGNIEITKIKEKG